jgi:DNA polymerase-3 subunit alpha
MEELTEWLDANKISFKMIDNEVIEIEDFGKMFLADLSGVKSIFKVKDDEVSFNLMEDPSVLMEEDIYYVAFKFGDNWYYYDLREEFKFNILKYIGKRQAVKTDIPFVNLGVHTPYELLNGSGDLGLWVKKAKYLGHTAIGICDRNTMAATFNLQKECDKAGIKHVFGYSFTLQFYDEKVDMKVYSLSQKGLRNLLRIQKEIMVDSEENVLTLSQLLTHGEGNVLVFGKFSSYWMKKNMNVVKELEKTFDMIFYQVDLSEYKAERIDIEVLNATKFYFDNFFLEDEGIFEVEPILICDNYYLDKDDAKNKIILNKIATKAAHNQSDDQYFKDIDEHLAIFQSIFDSEKWDVEALLELMCQPTVEIAEKATARFETGKMFMPEYIMLPDEINKYGDRHTMFLELLEEGLVSKIPVEEHEKYRKRLEEEIYIIESTNNVDYFLVQWDMVNEARKRGIVTGIGRGSAGGSLVSYLLGIISIDPLKYDLIFSRFLVPERCGLQWNDNTTIIGEDIDVLFGEDYVELELEGKTLKVSRDAEIRVKRGDEEMTVYADELQPEDDIIFDNKDLIWTLNEIQ